MGDDVKLYECSQCGSTDFEDTAKRRVRCTHCGSLFEVLTDEPKLTISKGANVTFGKNAKVEIRGDVEIEDGANVDVQGDITLMKGKKKQKFKLKLVESGKKKSDQ